MPYIVTTTTREGQALGHIESVSRLAVATLDEAQRKIEREMIGAAVDHGPVHGVLVDQTLNIGEAGGTIGPLPDGTTIEVAQWTRTAFMVMLRDRYIKVEDNATYEEMCVAYNAAQEREPKWVADGQGGFQHTTNYELGD